MTIRGTAFSLPKFPPAPSKYSASSEQAFRRTIELALNGIFVATNEATYAILGLPLIGWQHDITFSATDHDTVAWSSGTITLRNGTAYAIGAGNTGNITTVTYIFLDTAVSTTTLQTTTSASAAVGATRILIAVANDVESGKDAQFQVMGGADDSELVLITADVIAANTITANEIAANTITAAEIAAGTITATEIAAATITGDRIAAGTITATNIAALTITAAEIAASTITGDKISSLNISTKTLIADTGTVGGWTLAAGSLSSGSVTLSATLQRLLFGAASAPLTGVGVFLGLDGSDYEFRAGNPAGKYIHWDGSDLVLAGEIVTAANFRDSAALGWEALVRRAVQGARNLQFNPGFEDDLDFWVTAATGSSTVQVVENASQAHSGNKYVELSRDGSGGYAALVAGDDVEAERRFPVREGDEVHASCFAYEESGTGTPNLYIRTFDEDGALVRQESANGTTPSVWEEIELSLTIASGECYADFLVDVDAGMTVRFDDFRFKILVDGGDIKANSILATHINVSTLAAISADLGTVTAGTIQANVVVASTSFTATYAQFTGGLYTGYASGNFTATLDADGLALRNGSIVSSVRDLYIFTDSAYAKFQFRDVLVPGHNWDSTFLTVGPMQGDGYTRAKFDECQVGVNWEDLGTGTGAITVNFDTSNVQHLNNTGSRTVTLDNGQNGFTYILSVEAGSGAVSSWTWSTTIEWVNGTAPSLSTTSGVRDLIYLVYVDSTWHGSYSLGHA